jgi:hypothetical protein
MKPRILRYVELDTNGEPIHENFHSHDGGLSENSAFDQLAAAAARKGHTIVRLCNHDDNCRNPVLDEIEGDGNGGIRAKDSGPGMDGVELWQEDMGR